MRNIKDFDGGKQQIRVNSREEYLQIMPLLNTIYKGWTKSCMKEDDPYPRYISTHDNGKDSDHHTKHMCDKREIIDVGEYLEPIVLIFN